MLIFPLLVHRFDFIAESFMHCEVSLWRKKILLLLLLLIFPWGFKLKVLWEIRLWKFFEGKAVVQRMLIISMARRIIFN
jgi:hypothetical protein